VVRGEIKKLSYNDGRNIERAKTDKREQSGPSTDELGLEGASTRYLFFKQLGAKK